MTQFIYILIFILIPLSTIILLAIKNNTKFKIVLNSLLVINTIIFLAPAATVLFDSHSAAPYAYMFFLPLCSFIQIVLAFLKIIGYYTKSPISTSNEENNMNSLNSHVNDFDNTISERVQTSSYSKLLFILGILTVPAALLFGIIGILLGIVTIILTTREINRYIESKRSTSQSAYKLLKAGKIFAIIGILIVPLKIILFIILFFTGNMPHEWLI